MNELILDTTEGGQSKAAVVNYWLTTAADNKWTLRATIKESLTVQNECALKIAADEFSAVQTPRCSTQRVEHLQNKRS